MHRRVLSQPVRRFSAGVCWLFLFRETQIRIQQHGKRAPKSGVIGNAFFVENRHKFIGGALWLKALFWSIGQIKVGAQ